MIPSKKDLMVACLSVFTAMGVLMTPFSSFGQDASSEEQSHRTSGNVVEVDWVGGKIVVNTLEEGQVTFLVPDHAVLTRGSDELQFSDIDQGDQVEIEYVRTREGYKVVRLNDTNMANAF